MALPRLNAELWVKAQLRQCQVLDIPAFVVRRGDDTAGSVLLKLNRLNGACTLLAPTTDMDGNRAWMKVAGGPSVPEQDADAYIAKQIKFDPDIWVLEIEDRDSQYDPGEPVLD